MCRIADEFELWSSDEDWEELMSLAMDNYEQTFPKQTCPEKNYHLTNSVKVKSRVIMLSQLMNASKIRIKGGLSTTNNHTDN